MAKEYIEREALKQRLGDLYFQNYGNAILAVMEAPAADVVEVVRCKDCRWWNHAGCAIQIVDATDKPTSDDFCSFGERRDVMRLIDADQLKELILKERDAIPKTISERYGFGIGRPNNHGNSMRGGIRKALRCMEQCPTIEVEPKWIPASEPPERYRDEYGELIPLLVCEDGTDYPYRAFYDGRNWGDGYVVVPVKWWMPLPQPPKDGGA